MEIFTIVPRVNVILSCLKRPPLNFTLLLLPICLNAGVRLLSNVAVGLIVSSENP